MPVHPEHHAEHENGACEQQPAFISVFVEVQSGEGPGADKASNYSSYECLINGGEKIGAADLTQISGGDSDHESGFHALSQGDHEGLQHANELQLDCISRPSKWLKD